MQLKRLTAEHLDAVLAFETVNRDYFAASVPISDGEAEIGYRIGRDYAGRGLATDAVGRAIHLARHDYGLQRLRATADMDNHASWARPHRMVARLACSSST